jgi:tetratricopeptide (TPR) repeat protein
MALYDAFISYSHLKDKPIASALQSAIQKLGKPWYQRRALRLFRDDTSLSATPHLWPMIEQALGQSRHFLLLASPEAAASRWVNKEVAFWLENNSVDTLLASYQASHAIRQRLTKSDPGNASWQRGLAVSYEKVGDVQEAQGKLADALASYQASLAIRERLAQSDPGNAGWQRDLSVSYEKVGDVQVERGKLSDALASYQASLAIAKRLAQSDPGNADWQRDLAVIYPRLSFVYRRSNDPAKALAALRQGQAIMDRLTKLSPDNADWKGDLAWINDLIAALTK